jgi:asparagine synthase (glutamine-hydrolysing)
MSVQFGKCNFDGKPVAPNDLDRVRPMLAPYGPDGEGSICKDNVGILYRAFHTTKESRNEVQPSRSTSGAVTTWDGRLDNREELASQLGAELAASTDLAIVAAAYERWGTDAFAKLIGDWALSIWDPRSQTLLLAKDFVGTRHLYYSIQKEQVTWCTLLDPLVLFADRCLTIDEEYIAGWLSFFPATHLTPYIGIHSVPARSVVRLVAGRQTIRTYWDFDPVKRIHYRTDAEYEEHFRAALVESVRHRLRSDTPVLAELSGGMDSSSIVCVADDIVARGPAGIPRLDTVSYYDDTEPHWNERPYFTLVEERRGRIGCHIDVSHQESMSLQYGRDDFAATPASTTNLSNAGAQFLTCLASWGNRVVLSGIGGDEVLGGVARPIPELADLLASLHLFKLGHQMVTWALVTRKPLLHILRSLIQAFLPVRITGMKEGDGPVVWLQKEFVERHRTALTGYATRLKIFGARPSFQDNLRTLEALRRQLGCSIPSSKMLHEKRYPYLDRNFLEFLYALPADQVAQPGKRRSLMRRALAEIVPREVLNRKRKAFVVRTPIATISRQSARAAEITDHMLSGLIGAVNPNKFRDLLLAEKGQGSHIVAMMRTLHTEYWLRHLQDQGLIPFSQFETTPNGTESGQKTLCRDSA